MIFFFLKVPARLDSALKSALSYIQSKNAFPLLLCTGVVVTAGLFAAITAIHIVSLKCLGVHMILALLTRGRRQLFNFFFFFFR